MITMDQTEGLPGKTFSERRPYLCDDIASDIYFTRKESALSAGFVSALSLPVWESYSVLGVLLFFSSSKKEVHNEIISALWETGLQLGQFIKRKKLEADLIEERGQLALRVEERTKDLLDAQIQAEAANKAKSEFLASMSHELRTPLNSILGFSKLMISGMTGELTSEQKEFLGDINESGTHLLSLINDILDLSKVEAGKMDLLKGAVSVQSVTETAMTLFKEKTYNHNINFFSSCSVPADKDIFCGDERKIKQILLNLISNAVKFTPDGGSIGVSSKLVQSAGKECIEFSVKDTGIGISAENMEKLFKPFQQIDSSSTRNYPGTGLGLSLSKRFAEMHGGIMTVESDPGNGSVFGFRIPFEKCAPADNEESGGQKEE